MSQGAFRRARRPEQKLERRQAILGAARELAMRSGVRNVSLGCIASAVGLAKSNVVRYFGTREEIYLELTVQEWREFERVVVDQLADAHGAGDVIDVLTEALEQRPLFCDLLGECTTTLERNVSIDAARAFKLDAIRMVTVLGTAVARAHPGLTQQEATELVGAAAMLAGSLYSAANPSAVIAELYEREPEIAAAHLRFAPTLKRALAAIAAGLPTLR
jgi:AcrR family transcriptional regulator